MMMKKNFIQYFFFLSENQPRNIFTNYKEDYIQLK